MSSNPLEDVHERGIVKVLNEFGKQQRLDIDVPLSKEPDTFNLFLLAPRDVQVEKRTHRMSCF